MKKLYLTKQVYQLDHLAIEQDRQPAKQLMKKAAVSVWQAIQQRWTSLQSIAIFAGPGNNGGDAFAIACLAKDAGINVQVFFFGDLSRQSAESQFFRESWEQSGGATDTWDGQGLHCDLIVDGLLGIGLNKLLDDQWQRTIRSINEHPAIKVCIDIPSGLSAETGNPMPCAVKAAMTVTFIGRKAGCFLADGPDYCGELLFTSLGLSTESENSVQEKCRLLEPSEIILPAQRNKNSHKNQFGHVLVIGGGRGMPGAARLAARAALRSGAGLVSLCVHPQNYKLAAQDAEIMVSDWNELPVMLERASVIIIGPGLGQSKKARKILKQLQTVDKPMVVDADALHVDFISSLVSTSVVLTPHPGETARLLSTTTAAIQQDRLGAVQQLTSDWPYTSVLKGAGTLIAEKNQPLTLCPHGHAGMATAGMGDVLCGLVAGYLGQGLTPIQAAQTAVMLHALSAEHFAKKHDQISLIASDVIDGLSVVVKRIRQFSENDHPVKS